MKIPHTYWLLLAVSISACHKQHKATPVVTTPDYQKGISFLNLNDDSAFYYFNKATIDSRDSYQIAIAYNNMALIQADKGDYFGSQETLLTALKYLNEQQERDQYCLVAVYNQLGRNSSDLKNDQVAIGYYDTALTFSHSPGYKAIVLNNQAVSYQHLGQYAEAIRIYQSIIDQSKKNKKEYARILSNLAKVRWLREPGYNAATDLQTALQIRRQENDEWGLNASYAHLSDYYARSRPDSAFQYAGRMYAMAKKLQSPDDELEALQKLISLSPPGAIKKFFDLYRAISDSLQTARNAAKNQFALIRYQTEKNKADVLRLQRDNNEGRIQIIRQRTIIVSSISFFVIIIGFVVIRYKKRRQKLVQESRNAIRENQLNTSRKVHDIVANGLYRIMTQIEHGITIEKEQLLDQIEILYEKSRDISYEQPQKSYVDFPVALAGLIYSFASTETRVAVGNQNQVWDNVNEQVKETIESIMLELMINMKKHSSASHVLIRFERKSDCIAIHYSDDGMGLPLNFRYGNGLTNTENRIVAIGGRIIFDRNIEKGVKIHLSLPIT